jgi:integrase/recombinase XerD
MDDSMILDVVEAILEDNAGDIVSEVTALAILDTTALAAVVSPQNLDHHPAAVYLASLSPRSRRTMRGDLNTIAGLLTGNRQDALSLDWSQLRYAHCAAVRAALAERYAHSTANRMLSALRGVLKAAWRLGQLPTEEFHRAVDLPTVKGETLPRGRALSMGELRAVFGVCADGTVIGARDQALLAVLYGCGLRRGEAVGLDIADYDASTGELKVRAGKGNKQRLVYASSGVKVALERWLLLRGGFEGPLFVSVGKGVPPKGGKIGSTRLVDQTVMDILLKRARQAGLKKTSPHDFRRTFISDLLDAGADIATVQKLAGHANVTTTARYDRRGEVAKQKAAHLLHVPVDEV